MSLIDNQEDLIAQTQVLYNELLNLRKYAEAIAIGKLILDLSTAYKELRIASPGIEHPPTISPYSTTGFGEAFKSGLTIDQVNHQSNQEKNFPWRISQVLQEITQVNPQVKQEIIQALQLAEPVEPSKYSWADGFVGVTVPPNRNSVSAIPTDYWEDTRRQ